MLYFKKKDMLKFKNVVTDKPIFELDDIEAIDIDNKLDTDLLNSYTKNSQNKLKAFKTK